MFIGQWFFFALVGVFGVATVALLALLTTDGGPPVAFVLFWIFALGWNAYWWLCRVAYSLAADLREVRPDLDVRVGIVGTMGKWMPGPSAREGTIDGRRDLLRQRGPGFLVVAAAGRIRQQHHARCSSMTQRPDR